MQTKHSIPTVVVSEAVIYCEGKLLAEMSDGGLLQFAIQRAPKASDLDSFHGSHGWRYRTKDELARMVGDINRESMLNSNELLRMDKIRRLGWDHESRGY